MKRWIYAVLIMMCLLPVTGCKLYGVPESMKPGRHVLAMLPKNAPENYQRGWVDGCKTGMASMTNSAYRSFYSFTMDKELRNDPVYYRIWKDMLTFCRHYAYGPIRQGDDRMRLPEQLPTYWERVGGGHNLLENGPANMLGPATQGLMLEKWGQTAGDGFFEQAGVVDFSGDAAWNGQVASPFATGMTWNFAPAHSIAPY